MRAYSSALQLGGSLNSVFLRRYGPFGLMPGLVSIAFSLSCISWFPLS